MNENLFVDDKSFINIEIGAGCGNFGKLFYHTCYLTDKDLELKRQCNICHIDFFCDAHELPWSDNRFDKAILCNPYGYGFEDEESTELIMNELVRILKQQGQIIVISNHSNKHTSRIEKRIKNFGTKNVHNLNVTREEIFCETEFGDYKFKTVSGDLTIPNLRYTIHVSKN